MSLPPSAGACIRRRAVVRIESPELGPRLSSRSSHHEWHAGVVLRRCALAIPQLVNSRSGWTVALIGAGCSSRIERPLPRRAATPKPGGFAPPTAGRNRCAGSSAADMAAIVSTAGSPRSRDS